MPESITKNARPVRGASVPQRGAIEMSPKIMHFPQRRRNTDRNAAEIRQLRREMEKLRQQVAAMTPPAPWGLGDRHE